MIQGSDKVDIDKKQLHIRSCSLEKTHEVDYIGRKLIEPVIIITLPWVLDLAQCVVTHFTKLNPSEICHQSLCPKRSVLFTIYSERARIRT